jgi:TolA-binding protein
MKPHLSLAAVALVPAILLLAPGAATAQKSSTELTQAKQKIQKLEKEVQDRDQRINDLKNQVSAARPDDPRIRDLERRLRDRDAELAKLKDDANRKVHSELFNFKSTIDSDKARSMIDDANKKLSKIDGVRGVYIGKPQVNSEQEYDYAMVVLLDPGTPLDRLTGNDNYKNFQKNYAKSRIYDFQK